jgi:hypothetical protein
MTAQTVAADVADERDRQDAKWGEQNHPDGTGEHSIPLRRIIFHGPAVSENGDAHYAFGLALMAKQATDQAARAGAVTWSDILLEEVFEALAEDDPVRLRAELVQVAAVAQQWVEAIDRRVEVTR